MKIIISHCLKTILKNHSKHEMDLPDLFNLLSIFRQHYQDLCYSVTIRYDTGATGCVEPQRHVTQNPRIAKKCLPTVTPQMDEFQSSICEDVTPERTLQKFTKKKTHSSDSEQKLQV